MFNSKLLIGMESICSVVGVIGDSNLSLDSDSRKYTSGNFFMAIDGENFDGFDYIESVLDQGCPVVAYKNSEKNCGKLQNLNKKYPETVFISFDNSEKFLAELANKRIKEWKDQGGLVVGITGSNGKTTNKEMLYHYLNSVLPGKIHATKGNFNNQLGVPFTILDIKDEHTYAIIEMGSNHLGEIKSLCEIAMPDCGLISNIGEAHLEFFKTKENIFKEKKQLLDYVEQHTTDKSSFVICSDDFFLNQIESKKWIHSFGEKDSQNKIEYNKGKVTITTQGDQVDLINGNITGKHNFINLAGTFLLANSILGETNSLSDYAKSFEPSDNRSTWKNFNGTKIFMDAYNANPSSMEASLRSIAEEYPLDKFLFILGDMNELGEYAEASHKKIGKMTDELKIENVIFVGRYSEFYAAGRNQNSLSFLNTIDIVDKWPKLAKKYTHIFIKGSRTLQLESLADIKYFKIN